MGTNKKDDMSSFEQDELSIEATNRYVVVVSVQRGILL